MWAHLFPKLPKEYQIFYPINYAHEFKNNHRNPRSPELAVFADLRGVEFTRHQKNFFARECIRAFPSDKDAPLEYNFRWGCTSGREIRNRYGLSEGTVGHWICNLKKGKSVNQDGKSGRPSQLDAEAMRDYHETLKKGTEDKNRKRKRKFLYNEKEESALINLQHRKTLQRRGHDDVQTDDDEIIICINSTKKFKKVFIYLFYFCLASISFNFFILNECYYGQD
jgi:transposase